MKAPILLTGAGGVLGVGLARTWPRRETLQVLGRKPPAFWPRARFAAADLTEAGQAEALLRRLRPRAVLHAAGLTRLDRCEADPRLAQRINVDATHELAQAAREQGAGFVFISTEQVFDGQAEAYEEADAPSPIHVYGRTKAEGEQATLDSGGTVVRIPLLLGPRAGESRQGADRALLEALAQGKRPRLFTDEIRSPLHAGFVAQGLWKLLQAPQPGVFHLAGSEAISRHELGRRVCEAVGRAPDFDAVRASELDLHPPRPRRLVLNCERAQRELRWFSPNLRESLACLRQTEPESGSQPSHFDST